LQQNKYTAEMASAAHRHKLLAAARRSTKVCGGAAGAGL